MTDAVEAESEAKPKERQKKWIEVRCVECGMLLQTTPQAKRQRCRDCGRDHKRRLELKRHSERENPVRPHTLTCGHQLFFRIAPMSGEKLFCHRCDDWVLYHIPGSKRGRGLWYDSDEHCRNGHAREEHARKDDNGKWICKACHRKRKQQTDSKKRDALKRLGYR